MNRQLLLCVNNVVPGTHRVWSEYHIGRKYTLRDRYVCACGRGWLLTDEVEPVRDAWALKVLALNIARVSCARCDAEIPLSDARRMVGWPPSEFFIPLNDPDFKGDTVVTRHTIRLRGDLFSREEVARIVKELNEVFK